MNEKISMLQSSYQTKISSLIAEIQKNREQMEAAEREKTQTLQVIYMLREQFHFSHKYIGVC